MLGNASLFRCNITQVVFSRPAANAHVRKLAYEVCRHATLSVAEYHKLWEAVRVGTKVLTRGSCRGEVEGAHKLGGCEVSH